jgi:hypothetical protein
MILVPFLIVVFISAVLGAAFAFVGAELTDRPAP